MAILSDRSILQAVQAGDLRIEPFEPRHVTPNGVDLTCGEGLLPATGERLVTGELVVPPLQRFLLSTREVVTLGPALTGQLWIRSTYARRGALAAFGKVEAGFSGQLTVGLFNAGHEPLRVPMGDRFCQICLETLDGAAEKPYPQRSGQYQHSRGVTLG